MLQPKVAAWGIATGAAAGVGYASHDIVGAIVGAVVTAVLGFIFGRSK